MKSTYTYIGILLVLTLFFVCECGQSVKVLRKIPYDEGTVEIIHPVDWEMSIPIRFRINYNGKTIFTSSDIDYIFPDDHETTIINGYGIIHAFNCIVLIKQMDEKITACGFYALDIMEGYPKPDMRGNGYYEIIKKRWDTFCAEKGVSYQLESFPE